MEIETEYSRIDLRTSAGALLPWFGKMYENLNPIHTDGYADICFDPDGIRIETHDGNGHPISEETIPVNQIGVLSELYEGYRYQAFEPRRFSYFDLEEIQSWLSEFPPEQPITLCIDYDEGDVGIKLGGVLKYFGYSECQRPACVVLNEQEA